MLRGGHRHSLNLQSRASLSPQRIHRVKAKEVDLEHRGCSTRTMWVQKIYMTAANKQKVWL